MEVPWLYLKSILEKFTYQVHHLSLKLPLFQIRKTFWPYYTQQKETENSEMKEAVMDRCLVTFIIFFVMTAMAIACVPAPLQLTKMLDVSITMFVFNNLVSFCVTFWRLLQTIKEHTRARFSLTISVAVTYVLFLGYFLYRYYCYRSLLQGWFWQLVFVL